MQYKAYQPHYFNVVFATSQKYIFNVHQITTSGGKFNIFLARRRTKLPLIMHQNEQFQMKKITGRGIAHPQTSPQWEGVPPPHTPPLTTTKPSGSTLRPPKFQPDLRHWISTSPLLCYTSRIHVNESRSVSHSLSISLAPFQTTLLVSWGAIPGLLSGVPVRPTQMRIHAQANPWSISDSSKYYEDWAARLRVLQTAADQNLLSVHLCSKATKSHRTCLMAFCWYLS